MDRLVAALAAVVLLAAAVLLGAPSPAVATPPGAAPGEWTASLLEQTGDVPALATGVAAGPSTLVAVGGMTCERTRSDDFGRCWGQPWVSRDGASWQAVEARTSGLDLGRFRAATSGPEVGLDGIAHGPAGFVAFGWAQSDPGGRIGSGRLGVSPALWRSDDGAVWERLPTPPAFRAEGPIYSGAWPTTILGTPGGYLLGGVLYDTPAPRAAIWSSTDGRTWTLAGPDEAFDIGAYVDTLEIPAAGGIAAIAASPGNGAQPTRFVAVGEACPGPARYARPRGAWARSFEWTPGDCAARLWRSDDGLSWESMPFVPREGTDLAPVPFQARTVATSGERDVVGVDRRLLASLDAATWQVANGWALRRHQALASIGDRFYALVPACTAAPCKHQGLELWSSLDGLSWVRQPSQPTLPADVLDFVDVDMAAQGDRLVVTAGFFAAPDGELASMALSSPSLAEANAEASPKPAPGTSPATVVTLPPADAAPLPGGEDLPAGPLAYVAAASSDRPSIHLLDLETGDDVELVDGTRPDWSPDGTSLAYDCLPRGRDVASAAVCTVETATGTFARLIARAWDPQWSPDGRSLAFSRSRIDMGDAWVRDVVSAASVRLPGSQPQWSPAGDWVSTTTGSGVPFVTVARPDGSEERNLGRGWLATWSPDGSRIASAWYDGSITTISTMEIDTGATAPLFAVGGSVLALRWLPGDTMVLVTEVEQGWTGDLYAVDLGDLTARALTAGVAVSPDLEASSDGTWLAFSGSTAQDGSDVFLASTEGGWRQLTDEGDASSPTWAP